MDLTPMVQRTPNQGNFVKKRKKHLGILFLIQAWPKPCGIRFSLVNAITPSLFSILFQPPDSHY